MRDYHAMHAARYSCSSLNVTIDLLVIFLVFWYCSLLQAVLFIICMGLYFGKRQEYLAFLVLSVALCWVNLLYYSRGTRHMGIYSVMIQRVTKSFLLKLTLPE